jgi:galactose mutarotase-like enzyme
MHTLRNKYLTVTIQEKGAEMTSIMHQSHHREFLWQGDPAWWPRQAPVLFPIVGKLKDDTYHYNGKTYKMPQHGFARDMDFTVKEQSETDITLELISNEETKKMYPFDFVLHISYELSGPDLKVEYRIANSGDEKMYFSIGAHPGFNICQRNGETIEDYWLKFEQEEEDARHLLKGGFYTGKTEPVLRHDREIHLTHNTFDKDALVFQDLRSDFVSLYSKKHDWVVKVDYCEFPYVGIWSKPNAPFVCIEPWFGLADYVDHDGDLTKKAGIRTIKPHEVFLCHYCISVFKI